MGLCSTRELGEEAGFSEAQIRTLAQTGVLPYSIVGGKIVLDSELCLPILEGLDSGDGEEEDDDEDGGDVDGADEGDDAVE